MSDSVEVVENIGETELPWHIFYRSFAECAQVPFSWYNRYPIHFPAEIVDTEGRRIGDSMRELRDEEDGLHLKLTNHLPAARHPNC